ncbi:AraC family transcriptional regulator [Neiella marina]|uniref:AraC family transcriptional regulator n=1 Tax=Neiella marina TaxID=508461 RepID=A0A8J2XLF1_9GAMM|nr:AraC family transcriptional regulator [Neiella marina]GGA68931.1 AraC family transcriptional regulator [Neiella marina]
MKDVYCEPFCIEKGHQFEIHHVSYKAQDPYSCYFHFHEVHEFILFDDIDGEYFYSQGQSKLANNDIVFTPALESHDFELSDAAKSWYILQVDPRFFAANGFEQWQQLFKQGVHLRLPEQHINEVKQLSRWLLASYVDNPLSEKSATLLKLLIIWIAEHGLPVKRDVIRPINHIAGFDKLKPVMVRFQNDKAIGLSMTEAAELCHLSASHFSRLFKKIYRLSFSEYSLRYKLYKAARLLSSGHQSIGDISDQLDFSSTSHFIAQFKKQFSVTPLQYQKKVRSRLSD